LSFVKDFIVSIETYLIMEFGLLVRIFTKNARKH
jgi:hypothetical protein